MAIRPQKEAQGPPTHHNPSKIPSLAGVDLRRSTVPFPTGRGYFAVFFAEAGRFD